MKITRQWAPTQKLVVMALKEELQPYPAARVLRAFSRQILVQVEKLARPLPSEGRGLFISEGTEQERLSRIHKLVIGILVDTTPKERKS